MKSTFYFWLYFFSSPFCRPVPWIWIYRLFVIFYSFLCLSLVGCLFQFSGIFSINESENLHRENQRLPCLINISPNFSVCVAKAIIAVCARDCSNSWMKCLYTSHPFSNCPNIMCVVLDCWISQCSMWSYRVTFATGGTGREEQQSNYPVLIIFE